MYIVCMCVNVSMQGPVLYKIDKGVNDAARSPECGPAETGAFRPQVCLYWTMPARVKANSKLMSSVSSLGCRRGGTEPKENPK